MNQDEHLSTARELLQRVDQERHDGANDMIQKIAKLSAVS